MMLSQLINYTIWWGGDIIGGSDAIRKLLESRSLGEAAKHEKWWVRANSLLFVNYI